MANSPISLAGVAARALANMRSKLYQSPPITISSIDPAQWPNPLQPVQPVGPAGAQPLAWGFWQGLNQNITPRQDSPLSAQDLRNLAQYPLARILIENVKDTIASLDWKIKPLREPGEAALARDKRAQNDDNVKALTDFWSYPDGETPWKDWVRPLLEDLLVIDAPSILLQRTMAKKIVKARVIDGSNILRLIDGQGYTPAPPDPAYTQLWEGIPYVLLTTDQLVYRPRNIARRGTVASQLYGYSPTEQMATRIKTGIERMAFVLKFYTEGAVPGILHLVGPGADPDKILEGMRWMQSELAGNLGARRGYRMVQSFSGNDEKGPTDQIHEIKEPILADVFDDLLIRELAFGYGASAQRLLRMMNRATAQAGQEAAEEEGSYPLLQWLIGTINFINQRKMGMAGYEIVFDTAKELDPEKAADISKTLIGTGRLTIDEDREASGLKPFGLPETSQPMIITATGPVPLAGAIERTQQQHDADIKPQPAPVIAGGGAPKPTPKPAPAGKAKKKLQFPTKGMRDGLPVIDPDRHSPDLVRASKGIKASVWKFFQHAVIDLVEPPKAVKFTKTDKPDDAALDALTDGILADLDWSNLPEDLEPDLNAAAVEGVDAGLEQLEVTAQAVINATNQIAVDYAKDRAAEMVGMKWVDGELVTNSNAVYAISDSTRTMVRNIVARSFEDENPLENIIQDIKDAGVFSEKRATLIGQTEVSQAQVAGNYGVWVESGVVEEVASQLSGDHDDDDICDLNAEAGSIKIGETFPSGHKHPLYHPRCECILRATKVKGVEL